MKTKIKIIFKDNTECVFNANTHTIDDDNYDYDFYRLGLIDENGNYKFVALVSIPDIKVISYIESEMNEEIEDEEKGKSILELLKVDTLNDNFKTDKIDAEKIRCHGVEVENDY